jgi:murein DD-endopeptidase MepM/ murein hydrolase activator NlpD
VSLAERCLAALAAAVLLLARWSAPAEAARPRPLLTVRPLGLPVLVRQDVLKSGETLGQLLTRLGVPNQELQLWVAAVQGQLDPHSVPAGLAGESVTDVHGAVVSVRLRPGWRTTVVAERSGERVLARREERSMERELVVVRGSVRSSLFDAVTATGEGESLALELADLFQWDIDFHREVRTGDAFAILIERIRSEGRTVGYGPVVAASYTNRGRTFSALRFAAAAAHPSFYDAHGSPLRKQFLRAPLRFSRITSRYTMARLHPILGIRLPHWGVDYGAPVGTPVMTTADGFVASAGENGGGGNMVELRHAGGFSTSYMHLSRFAAGIRPGARVEQGQVVGYVGATGLATGPHLDYRVTQNGRHLNPLSIGREPAPSLARDQLPAFTAWAERVLPFLSSGGPLRAEQVAALAEAAPFPLHG